MYIKKDKIWLQTWLQLVVIIPTKKISMTIYFENLTIRLHIFYILNTHIKFRINHILFTI